MLLFRNILSLLLILITSKVCLAFFGESVLFNSHQEPEMDVGDNFKTSIALAKVNEKWITQKVDNFDESNHEEWNMRYLENSEHFRRGTNKLFL